METDGWSFLLEVLPALAVPLAYWIRTLQQEINDLTNKIGSVSQQITKMSEENTREHGNVGESVQSLRSEIVREMRGVIQQHSDHDKQNTRIETKVDVLLHEIRDKQQ